MALAVNYKNLFYILALLILGFLTFHFFSKPKEPETQYNSNLIQEQIKNVGKLVVTEGHYSQVLTFKDQNSYLGGLISFDKKAVLIVNSEVSVAYDLRKMRYDINQQNKTITIINIPKEEIKISPDIQYYNIEQSKLNQFTGDDFNKINQKVKADLAIKIEKSALKANAKNRLVNELSKLLLVTHSVGWKLQYNGQIINEEAEINKEIGL